MRAIVSKGWRTNNRQTRSLRLATELAGLSHLALDYVAFIRRGGVPGILRYAQAIGITLEGIVETSEPFEVFAALELSIGASL